MFVPDNRRSHKFMFSLSKNVIKQALDLSPVATLIVDLKADPPAVQYVNQSFEALSGYDAGELIGRPWSRVCDTAAQPNESAAAMSDVALRCHPRLGASDFLKLDLVPLYDGPGTPRYWLGTECQETGAVEQGDSEREALLSVLRDARSHLRRLDGRDAATGVLNRRAFDDLLQRDWILARREQRSVAVMVFKIEHFDAYGDVFGRHAADACLRKVAHAISGSLRRASDLTARYADDSFAVLMGEADEAQAKELAHRIAAKVRGLAIHHPRSTHDRFVSVSCGVVSVIPEGTSSQPDLIAQAEQNRGRPSSAAQRLSAG